MTQMTQRLGNTKKPLRSRRWCFTLNNHTTDEYNDIIKHFDTKNALFCIGEEIGESETPHLQGYIEFKNPRSFESIKKINKRLHIEKAKGSREQNITYCTKDGKFKSNFPLPRKQRLLQKYTNTVWKEWQQNILNIINTPPDDRTINWIYDPIGNTGKSYLARYLMLTHDIILCDGKATDVFNQLKTFIDEHPDKDPTIVILDVPRHSFEYINYGMLEKLKNGFLYSGKYEGGQLIFEPPHVFVFANEEPDYSKFSEDRWNVMCL